MGSLADECVQLIGKIVEEKIVEKLDAKDPSYLYLDSTTIVDMKTLQFLPCQQDFPAELSDFWSQAAVVRHTCAVLDNTVYVIGGRSHHTSVEMLSLDSNSWVYGPSLPDDATDAQTVVYNDTLYVLEGNGLIYRLDRSQDLWVIEYNILTYGRRNVFPAPLLTEEQLPCK